MTENYSEGAEVAFDAMQSELRYWEDEFELAHERGSPDANIYTRHIEQLTSGITEIKAALEKAKKWDNLKAIALDKHHRWEDEYYTATELWDIMDEMDKEAPDA